MWPLLSTGPLLLLRHGGVPASGPLSLLLALGLANITFRPMVLPSLQAWPLCPLLPHLFLPLESGSASPGPPYPLAVCPQWWHWGDPALFKEYGGATSLSPGPQIPQGREAGSCVSG